MDAMLWELLAEGSPDDRVEVLIKLSELGKAPADYIEVVAQIGNIVSCRIRRGDIETVRGYDVVLSMKAQKPLFLDPPVQENFFISPHESQDQQITPRRPDVPYTGKGIKIGIADWGFDFTHPNFLYPDGSSRFIAIWDQGAEYDGNNIYGFGTVHIQEDINHALASELPFQALNYHPGKSDVFHQGMHGTHVLDIAAGNGTVGATGIAPEADLIAVHLATDKSKDLMGLGTSVRVFDAIHFLDATADNQPLVINMSVGSHGDSHTGRTLIEQAIDHLVTAKTCTAFTQSCGNYFSGRTHAEGYLAEGGQAALEWLISEKDKTQNEIEIWYEPPDKIKVGLQSPNGTWLLEEAGIGRSKILDINGAEIGRYYHRENEPNTQLNQIVIVLDKQAAYGKWEVLLTGKRIASGRYQSWIERDLGNLDNQSRFAPHRANSNTTTGSICNGFYNICVGAIDSSDNKVGFFSSIGPTWDGRDKPDEVAPGVNILAAKSAAPYQNSSMGELTRKTGTSMAAPYVAGAVALLYESSGKPLTIQQVKSRLREACNYPILVDENEKRRYGCGVLNIGKLLADRPEKKTIPQFTNSTIMNEYNEGLPLGESNLEAFTEMTEDQLCEYFESLPTEKNLWLNQDVKRGDIILRRQHGHHQRIVYGPLAYTFDNQAFVFFGDRLRKIQISKDNQCLDWEVKIVKAAPSPKQLNIFDQDSYNAGYLMEDKGPTGEIKGGVEADLAEFKTVINTTYGKWTTSTTLKTSVLVSGKSGLPVGGGFAQTSKLQGGERVVGAKTEFSYSELQDIFKKLKIENFTIKLGGEWSGSEISAYAVITFDFITSLSRTPAALKIFIFKVKEGENFKLGDIEGYFDSPSFEIKIGGEKTKVFVRYKVSWRLDKAKVAQELLKKIAKEKLEQEAKKQGVKYLGRKAGETILKRLGPLVTAFGIGWDIGTLLNDFTVADEVARNIQQDILGDLNVRYQQADTLGKMVLITKNSPRIIAALIASGVGGVTAGIGDIVLFKIFGLDKLADFGTALNKFLEILDSIPNVGGGFVDMIEGEVIKIGIKLNPQYANIADPELKKITTALFTKLKPIYKQPNALDKLISLHLYDFDVDYGPFVDVIIRKKLKGEPYLNLNVSKQEVLTNLLDLHLADFIRFLESNDLISYKIKFGRELGTEPIDQKLVNELFL